MRKLLMFLGIFLLISNIQSCNNTVDIGDKYEIGTIYPNVVSTKDTLTISIIDINSGVNITSLKDITVTISSDLKQEDTLSVIGIKKAGDSYGNFQINLYTEQLLSGYFVIQSALKYVNPGWYTVYIYSNQYRISSKAKIKIFNT